MKKKVSARLCILFLFVLAIQPLYSQSQEYAVVDSMMRNYREKIKTQDDLYKVVYFIRKNFTADSLRLRAAFIWITWNIDYDVRAFQEEDRRAAQLDYVVQKKKAICSGYASLLKYFCDAFTIPCEIVDGYARSGRKGIVLNQQNLRNNHAWNTVKINDRWRLVDPTWAAGYINDTDEEDLKYTRRFNETYYFTEPDRLILNHLPRHSKHQFLLKNVPEPVFKRWPLFTTHYLNTTIQKIYPDTSLIRARRGDTLVIRFQFGSVASYSSLCAFSKNEKAAHTASLIKKDDWYEFRYPIKLPGYYDLHIGECPFKSLVSYRLEVN